MEMPKPKEQHHKLRALAGKWVGEEKLHPSPWDPEGGFATGHVDARIDLDGFYLISDYVEDRYGQVCYRGHGVMGWDSAEQCYTMHWFDSIGVAASIAKRGTWEDNKLTFEHETPMGHARYTYVLEGEGRYLFRIENSKDGKEWTPFMEGSYRRRSS